MARNASSHPALSHLDGMVAAWSDFLLLVGRVLFGCLFLATGWLKFNTIAGNTAYFTSLGLPSPEAMVWVVAGTEVVLGAALILGIATRYAALASFIFVLIATWIAHRYWTYPAAAQGAQYFHFLKNLAIMSGAVCVFVTGAGRYSVDAKLAKR
jgi:putative oxidoreductase